MNGTKPSFTGLNLIIQFPRKYLINGKISGEKKYESEDSDAYKVLKNIKMSFQAVKSATCFLVLFVFKEENRLG